MTCPHQLSMDKTGRGKCSLGLYGGKPWLGNCIECGGKPEGYIPPARGLGDVIEKLAHPIAVALKLPCLDSTGTLKPESPCAKRRDAMNRMIPFRP